MFALKGFSESDFDILRRFLVRNELKKNQPVIESGGPALKFFLVEEGSVKIVQRTAKDGSDEIILGVVKGGGFFGEEALLRENQNYMNSVFAVENSVLLCMDREGLQKLMGESIAVGTKLLLALSKNYREALTTPESMGKIMAFYSPKGGTGCTTMAVNTAAMLASQKRKVAFIDCDMQFGNANIFLGAPPNLNVGRLVQMEENLIYDRIKGFLTRRAGVDCLFSPDLPQEAELVTRANLNQIIRALGPHYEFIIIDCRSEIDDQTLLLWDLADLIVMVTHSDLAGLTRIHRLFRVITRLNYPKSKFAVLVNRFAKEAQATFLKEFQKFQVGVVQAVADESPSVSESMFSGIPHVEANPKSRLAADLGAFINSLTGIEVPVEQKGGIFSKLRSMFS